MAGAAQGIVDFIRGFGQRKEAAQVKDQLKNYMTDPTGTITAVNQIDPYTGMALNTQHQNELATQQARTVATQTAHADAFKRVTGYLRGMPEGSDYGAAIDGMAPYLKGQLGASDQDIAGWKQVIASDPTVVTALDDKAMEAVNKSRYGTTTAAPGDQVLIGGKLVSTVPYALKTVTAHRGDGGTDVVTTNPNTGPTVTAPLAPGSTTTGTPAPAPADPVAGTVSTVPPAPGIMGAPHGPLTVASLAPHFLAQESGGNYTAQNKDTGALGAYQVMPATGAALAKRLGMPWRPDMMVKDDQQSKNYQDKIGQAGIQDAVDHSGGDPRTAFSYYYGGSDRGKWGPKTHAYADQMMARYSGQPGPGDGSPGAPPPGDAGAPAPGDTKKVYSTSGKPTAHVRAATAAEVKAAGYPDGTAAQVDDTGKFVNLKEPPAAVQKQGKPGANTDAAYQNARDGLLSLKQTYQDLMDNPNLGSATGLYGSVAQHIPGTAARGLHATAEKAGGEAMTAVINNLKAFSANGSTGVGRLTNMEAQAFKNSMAPLDFSQNTEDFKVGLKNGQARIDKMIQRLDQAHAAGRSAPSAAAPANVPKVGYVSRGFRFTGGDPSSPSSWEKIR